MKKYTETKEGREEINRLTGLIIDAKSGKKIEVDCPRCNGAGGMKHYAHVYNGVCFLCKGTKKTFSFKTPEQQDKNREIKKAIETLKNKILIPQEIVNEFASIPAHQTPFFADKIEQWLWDKDIKAGTYDKYSFMHRVNCTENFMYE